MAREDANELIERYVEEDRHRPGAVNARIVDHGVHVWAIIGLLRALDQNVHAVASEYELPEDAIQAAIAYYQRNRIPIEAQLISNAAPQKNPSPAT